MAKQPDDHLKQPRPDHDHKSPHEAEEVLDAEVLADMTDGPKTNNPSPPPTRIAPYQADDPNLDDVVAAELLADEQVPIAQPVHPGYVPNMSLEEPIHQAEEVEEPGVLEDEPVLAEKLSSGSSVIEAAEIVDEHPADEHHADRSHEAHVLGDEAGHGPHDSSVVEATEMADIVEDSDIFTDETLAGSSVASASALLGDSAVKPPSGAAESSVIEALPASDVVMSAEDVMPDEVITAQEASGVVPSPATPPPVLAKPPASVREPLDEQRTIYAEHESGEKAPDAYLEDETMVLGSEHERKGAAPDHEKVEGPPPADLDVHETDEIDWDDVGPLADSKVVKQEEDASHVVTFEAKPDEAEEVTDAEVMEADMTADEEPANASKKGEPSREVVFDDMDADALAAEALHDDAETAKGAPGAGHTGDLAAFLDEEEMALAQKAEDKEEVVAAEAVPVAKKKKDAEKLAVPVGTTAAKPVDKRSFAGSWLGGMAVSILVLLGGAAALWYFSPDTLKGVYEASPSYVAPKKPQTVASVAKTAQQPKADEAAKSDPAELAQLKERADKAEKELSGVSEVLANEKLGHDKDKADLDAVRKALAELKAQKDAAPPAGDIAAVNKVLAEAKVKEGGDKGVAILAAAKKDADEKLDAVNKMLVDAKVAGMGPKGIEELLEARNKLAKDRDELDQALKGAYEDLATSGLATPGEDPRAKIGEAVKNVRLKVETMTKLLEERAAAAPKQAEKQPKEAPKTAKQDAPPAPKTAKQETPTPKAVQPKVAEAPKVTPQEAAPVAFDPALGEEHYGKGLTYFWSRRYGEAEGQFRQAIRYFDQDARFFYFLGMTLVAQGNSQAAGPILEQGARLEAANRPSLGEVNASLERVQGSLRAFVNSYRHRAMRVAAN